MRKETNRANLHLGNLFVCPDREEWKRKRHKPASYTSQHSKWVECIGVNDIRPTEKRSIWNIEWRVKKHRKLTHPWYTYIPDLHVRVESPRAVQICGILGTMQSHRNTHNGHQFLCHSANFPVLWICGSSSLGWWIYMPLYSTDLNTEAFFWFVDSLLSKIFFQSKKPWSI